MDGKRVMRESEARRKDFRFNCGRGGSAQADHDPSTLLALAGVPNCGWRRLVHQQSRNLRSRLRPILQVTRSLGDRPTDTVPYGKKCQHLASVSGR